MTDHIIPTPPAIKYSNVVTELVDQPLEWSLRMPDVRFCAHVD